MNNDCIEICIDTAISTREYEGFTAESFDYNELVNDISAYFYWLAENLSIYGEIRHSEIYSKLKELNFLMSDKEYKKLKESRYKVYKIFLKGKVLQKEEILYEQIDSNWFLQSWINKGNIHEYSGDSDSYEVRYVSEDRLELQIRKYLERIRNTRLEEIRKLEKQLKNIESVAKNNGVILN